jgi:hypothetical protein
MSRSLHFPNIISQMVPLIPIQTFSLNQLGQLFECLSPNSTNALPGWASELCFMASATPGTIIYRNEFKLDLTTSIRFINKENYVIPDVWPAILSEMALGCTHRIHFLFHVKQHPKLFRLCKPGTSLETYQETRLNLV